MSLNPFLFHLIFFNETCNSFLAFSRNRAWMGVYIIFDLTIEFFMSNYHGDQKPLYFIL